MPPVHTVSHATLEHWLRLCHLARALLDQVMPHGTRNPTLDQLSTALLDLDHELTRLHGEAAK